MLYVLSSDAILIILSSPVLTVTTSFRDWVENTNVPFKRSFKKLNDEEREMG